MRIVNGGPSQELVVINRKPMFEYSVHFQFYIFNLLDLASLDKCINIHGANLILHNTMYLYNAQGVYCIFQVFFFGFGHHICGWEFLDMYGASKVRVRIVQEVIW